MTAAVLPFVALAFVAGLAFSAYRLLRGPTVPDRILALDTLYVNAVALLMLLGIVLDTKFYFEAALVIVMLGFIGTVALARFVLRGDIIEPR
jgi:multicomponent K+:H+ antiporter subunit F